jgi:hypothetical protein
MPAIADMNGGQIGFYAAVAAAIPVLLLAYVVEISGLSRRAVESVDKTAASGQTAVLARIRAAVPDARTARWLSAYVTFSFGLLSGQLRRTIVQTLLLVLVLLPVAGEVASLIALGGNRSTHATYLWAWIGLSASAAGVLIPVFVTTFVLYRPVFMVGLVLHTLEQLQTDADLEPAGVGDSAEASQRDTT